MGNPAIRSDMGRTTVDIRTFRVPADDGTFAQALAALDQKLADWADAMRAAQQAVVEAAMREQAAAGTCSRPARAAHAHNIHSDRQSTIPQREVGAESDSPNTVKPDIGSAVAPMTPEVVCPALAVQPGPGPGIESAALPGPPATDQEQAAATSSPEDETLLASLDPETANAVRVMRRLSPMRKSVRELLKEYEASRPTLPAAGQTKKRSWFLRGW